MTRLLKPILLASVILVALARADLPDWVRFIESGSAIRAAFIRAVPMPSALVPARRPPRETRAAVSERIAAAPSDAELLALRARVAEEDLDPAAAEADWQKYATSVSDRAAGYLALADFYHRRVRPLDEVKALSAAAQQPSSGTEQLKIAQQQRAWQAFERIFRVIEAHAVSPAVATEHYRAWIARYPAEPAVYQRFLNFLLAQKQFAAAEPLIVSYQKAFPADDVFPVQARALVEQRRGAPEQAVAYYDKAFQPLWPPALVKSYFGVLEETRKLRDYLARARAAATAHPQTLEPAARIFYYFQQQGNAQAAQRALLEFRARKESAGGRWTAEELFAMARLLEAVQNHDEAARFYYALYSLPGGGDDAAEKALGGLFDILMNAPEQPVAFGSGDLSLYRDVATMDPHPGFLNGILSLVLNTTYPPSHYANQERVAVAYFHRARAAELLALFDTRFPRSARRADMHARLIEAYSTYGDSEGVIRAARAFLSAFSQAAERSRVTLLMADAFARRNDTREEFAAYDALLRELAARASGVPLGAGVAAPVPRVAPAEAEETEPEPPGGRPMTTSRPMPGGGNAPRSPEYARVLDRYIARLAALKRPMEALAVYRREIDRNPNDPGLYERLAAFVEQNKLASDVEQTYRAAMRQFPERTWHHRLARWYLRQKQEAAFEQLTREVVQVFSGSELETYFREVAGPGGFDARLYVRINQFAHQRFPSNLSFVRNLLNAYGRRETRDAAGQERLLRMYWLFDEDLRVRFFQMLSSSGRLAAEVEQVRAANAAAAAGRWTELGPANPAATRFLGEAEAWRSHFEDAAAPISALSAVFSSDEETGRRAASLERSLAAFDPAHSARAVAIEERLHRYEPRDRAVLTRIGEVYADREMYREARPWWNRIAQIEPGVPDGYLEAATVFWDYFQFDDALRLLAEARKAKSDSALYAYEVGAIHENKRQYARAVEEYVKGAATGEEHSPARARLLVLARRPAQQARVEAATAKLAAARPADVAVISLRLAVLEAGNRRADMEKFLLALVAGTSSFDVLSRADRAAEQHGFEQVRLRSLERQIAISTDPVERIRLRLALVRYHESRQDTAAARAAVEALYHEHPRVLGVVRAATDFYWRNKLHEPAVATLLQASSAAHPALKKQFTFEAARKATEAGRYEQARQLLDGLRKDDPFNAEYLAAVADTYAREGNDRALRDFYSATIEAVRQAAMDAAGKTSRIAALRRGLIPALTRLNEHAAAVDQYIEIINRFPEDESLVREAATYAATHNRTPQLLAFYAKTADASPRDFRWPMVLARLHTAFEDFPQAIAAYSRATRIRPDRVDLHAARASLEERLARFDDAARDYTQLYDLTYRNPQWMEKLAEVRARQGQSDAAVQALVKAWIEGRPESPALFFAVAERLESWNLLQPAREYADRGVTAAGSELLASHEHLTGVQAYARVMTRLRQHETAFARLAALVPPSPAGVPPQPASPPPELFPALTAMARAAGEFFTPEEKAALAAFLQKQQAANPASLPTMLLPLAEHAGLAGLEAQWRYELMMAQPGAGEAPSHEQRLVQLQTRRMRFAELGAQMEAYWKVYPDDARKPHLLELAATAYRSAGDRPAEIRVLGQLVSYSAASAPLQARYFELLGATQPDRLVALAGGRGAALADAATEAAIAISDSGLAQRAVAARGRALPAVWTRAYTALAGLYHADTAAPVHSAFTAALGSQVIGEQVGKPVDRDQQLAGDTWFYYASRYGEYLQLSRRPNAADYLPAEIERTPARAAAYFDLAEYYRERGDAVLALADYAHALELDPVRAEAHDRTALILWEQGRRDEAAARWKQAIAAYARLQDRARVPESFWSGVRGTLENVGSRGLLATLRDDADRLLRTYIRRNGNYRVEPLLQGAMAATGDTAAGVAWVADLSRAASDPVAFLGSVVDAEWVPAAQREMLLGRIVEAAEARAAEAHGQARELALETLYDWRIRRAASFLAAKQPERARAELDAIPADVRQSRQYNIAPLEVRIAAQTGTLDALIEAWRREPEKTPHSQVLLQAGHSLRESGLAAPAAKLLEFVYETELGRQNLDPANFLGLAELRLEAGDVDGAMRLLRRMTLVSGAPFETHTEAAALLEKKGRPAEAARFLAERVQAVPWDAAARVRLAAAQIAAGRETAAAAKVLASLAASAEAPYASRAEAARLLGRHAPAPANSGSAELDLLARSSPVDVTTAERPYFYHARLAAAENAAPDARIRLALDAVAIVPDDPGGARLAVLRAALDAGRDRLAVSAAERLHEQTGLRYTLERGALPTLPPQPGEEGEMAYEGGGGRDYGGFATQFLAGSGLETPARAALARRLAAAMLKLDQLANAEAMFQIAYQLEAAATNRDAIRKELDGVRAESARRTENALRRPRVTPNLEQAHLVRPMVKGGRS